MLFRDFYYAVKPAIPRRLRLAVRRARARRIHRRVATTWPIDPRACRIPPGWNGWPDGRRFAFVLTHDVEGTTGLDRCGQLADLETSLGFRSAFNFVPEGEYRVPEALRRRLTTNGFEVGVHDLHHDGRLYRSHSAFLQHARAINRYVREWNASGFRSAFMLHDLDWLQALDVEYDASTFDTDPFEPQPDGVQTIFPFEVRRPDGTSYTELPYTLAQDSTLFLILQQPTIDLWTTKLDWVASHGGLALVNVHPDYIAFDGEPRAGEYGVALYRGLLEYVRARYEGSFWHARPRDVASHVARRQAA